MNQTIRRDHYMQKLIDRKENGLVKVITGIRRCGKSFLLFNLFYDYLIESGVKEEQIISIALDDDTFIKYREDVYKRQVRMNARLCSTTLIRSVAKSSARPGQSSTLPSKTDYQK